MKKLYFKKLLSLFLAGTVLAGVGCKDYDDDIKKTNDRIDQLETGKLASIDEQIKSINASISSLDAAYKAADAALQTALDKQATALTEAKTALQKSIDDLKTSTTTDINKLKGDLTALGTKVDGINTTLAAEIKKVADNLANNYTNTADMKAYVATELGKLDAKIAGEIAAVKTRMGLAETAITDIQTTIEAMKTQIAGKVDKSEYDTFTQKTNEAIQKNAEALSLLQTLVGEFPEGESVRTYIDKAISDVTTILTQFKAEYDTFVAEFGAYKLDIETRLSAAEASIASLKEFETEMREFMNGMTGENGIIAGINSEITRLSNEKTTLAEVKSLFVDGNNEFTAGVEDILKRALDQDGLISSKLATELGNLRDGYTGTLKGLDERIAKLEGQVGAIADRIQSLVFVPTTADGKIHFGKDYIGANAGATTADTYLMNTGKQFVTYRVTPAKLASDIVAGFKAGTIKMEFVTEEVTRAGAPTVSIVDATADIATGKITMLVNTPYEYTEKDLAVALRIQQDNDKVQGVEFVSHYTTSDNNGKNLYAKFVLAKVEMVDGKKVYTKSADAIYTKEFNDMTPVTLFNDYEVVFEDAIQNNKLISTAEAKTLYNWDVTPETAPVIARSTFTNNLTASTYTTNPTNPVADAASKAKLATVTITAKNTTNVDKAVSEAGKAFFKLGSKSYEIGAYSSTVNYTRHSLGDFEFNVYMNWNYTKWSAGFVGTDWSAVSYSGMRMKGDKEVDYVVFPAKALTADQFNAISTGTWKVDVTNFTGVGKENISVVPAIKSSPLEDDDAMALGFNIKNYIAGSGTIVASMTLLSGDGEAITVKTTITVAQPAVKFSVAPVASIVYQTTTAVNALATNWISTLYNANTDLKSKFGFATQADFTAYIDALTFGCNCTWTNVTEPTNGGDDHFVYNNTTHNIETLLIGADFTKTNGNFVNTTMELEDANAPSMIEVKGTINFTKNAKANLIKQMNFGYLATGVDPKATANGKYVVDLVYLPNYYDAEDTSLGLALGFAITTAPAKKGDSDVTGEKKLSWGTCNETLLALDASLKSADGNTKYDQKAFDISLKTPIDVTKIALKENIDETVPTGVSTSLKIDLFKKLTWKDIYGNELFMANGFNNTVQDTSNKPIDFTAADCYKLAVDWSGAKIAVTDAATGDVYPSTPLTLNTVTGEITYDANQVDPARTYIVKVTGAKFKARYNADNAKFVIEFKLIPETLVP